MAHTALLVLLAALAATALAAPERTDKQLDVAAGEHTSFLADYLDSDEFQRFSFHIPKILAKILDILKCGAKELIPLAELADTLRTTIEGAEEEINSLKNAWLDCKGKGKKSLVCKLEAALGALREVLNVGPEAEAIIGDVLNIKARLGRCIAPASKPTAAPQTAAPQTEAPKTEAPQTEATTKAN